MGAARSVRIVGNADLQAAIDIARPLRELCRRLDVPYDCVKEIVFHPADTSVTLFIRGEDGGFVMTDGRSGAKCKTLRFRTRS